MIVKRHVGWIDSGAERGAALVTTILITLLLGTACIAMLSAVSASSKNNTDALSENKAYYAAESGLQASINVLRNMGTGNKGVPYTQAIASPSDLSPWLGSGKIPVGSEASYTIAVSDPDHSSDPIVYRTTGSFQQADGTYASTRVYDAGSGNTSTFSFDNYTSSTSGVPQPLNNTPLGSLRVQKALSGATIPNNTLLYFKIDYVITAPRAATKTIRGSVDPNGNITILNSYFVLGSTLTAQSSFPSISTTSSDTVAVTGSMAVIEPYRLKILSTGYGPNSASKRLEGVIQKNFFNDLPSENALTLVAGANCNASNTTFNVGTSNNMNIVGGSSPSVGASTSAVLSLVTGAHTNGTMTPPPEVIGADAPAWQRSPATMDALIRQLRQTAQNSGRYFTSTPTSWGDLSTGTGITFCEGSCNLGNDNGGGILVVTGTLTTSGNPQFNGLILAVGPYVSAQNPGGMIRSGGGQEAFIGNIVIAPYNPNNLAADWGCPYYDQQGGSGATVNSAVAVNQAFDGTGAITHFMLGVAEK